MDTITLKDHDEIRAWIEEHGGKPVMKDRRGDSRGVIDIAFSNPEDLYEIISWEEFFDTFDALNMEFCYEYIDELKKEFTYSFVNQDQTMRDVPNENEMPEDDVPVENVVPSAPVRTSPDGVNPSMNYDIL
jgi:hypothetical protein